MSENAIRVLIADDHEIVRKGIRVLLSMEHDIEVVGEAVDGRRAVEQAETLCPDVILMDLVMPHMDGIKAIKEIAVRRPSVRILVLTSFVADEKVFPAIKAGALGYLLKDCQAADLVRAIRRVFQGDSWLDPAIARKVLAELVHSQDCEPKGEVLTERELEVLRLVAAGLENQEIAERLVITEATARSHVSNILGKLHLASRTQVVLYALRTGLASLDSDSEGR